MARGKGIGRRSRFAEASPRIRGKELSAEARRSRRAITGNSATVGWGPRHQRQRYRSQRNNGAAERTAKSPLLHKKFGNQRPKGTPVARSEEHTSELQSHLNLVCRLLLEKK